MTMTETTTETEITRTLRGQLRLATALLQQASDAAVKYRSALAELGGFADPESVVLAMLQLQNGQIDLVEPAMLKRLHDLNLISVVLVE